MTLYADYTQIGNNKYYHRDLEARAALDGLGALSAKDEAALDADVSGILPIANGGTGASSAAAARSALGLVKTYAASLGACYVSTSGNDTTGDGTVNKPWRTIQKAIDEAPYVMPMEIRIAPGTYNENVVVANKYVTLINTSGNNGGYVVINGSGNLALDVRARAFCLISGNFNLITTNNAHILNINTDSVVHQTSGDLKIEQANTGSIHYGIVIARHSSFNQSNAGIITFNIAKGSGVYAFCGANAQFFKVKGSVSDALFSVSEESLVSINNYSEATFTTAAAVNSGSRIYSGVQTSMFNY